MQKPSNLGDRTRYHIKYNVDNGWVKISLNADVKSFYIKVADSGVGIPDDAKDKCMHEHLVRLYTFGAKSDYGCLDCGMESASLSEFLTDGSVAAGHAS